MTNSSIVAHFLLVGFSEAQELQNIPFVLFPIMYLMALMGNFLIIMVVVLNNYLHTPMYFFVLNLSVVDVGSISVTIPKAMANSLKKTRWILYSHCIAQTFFYVLFCASEVFLLTVMAYDRYVAICHPLHYETVLNRGSCILMASFAWMLGILTATLHTGATFASPFCSNIINQFFCEIPPLLKLSCSNMYLIEVGAIVLTASLYFGCFIFIIITYVQIFKAVMRIPSAQGRERAFSTCLPHLLVLFMFYFFGVFVYFRPFNRMPSQMDLVAAVAYCVMPPLLNPIIYSMRNKDIKAGMWKLMDWRYSARTGFCFT